MRPKHGHRQRSCVSHENDAFVSMLIVTRFCRCFAVSGGGLQLVPGTVRSLGLNQTTPATGPYDTGSQVVFTKDQKSLVAAVKGTPTTPGFLAAWVIKSLLERGYEVVGTGPYIGIRRNLRPTLTMISY